MQIRYIINDVMIILGVPTLEFSPVFQCKIAKADKKII